MSRWMGRVAALVVAGTLLMHGSMALALDKINAGAVGGPTGTMWLYYVGFDKGFFSKAGIELDLVYAHTAPGIMQQLTAGSLDIVATTGVVEPIHAVDKGATNVAIARIIGQNAPYSMEAKPSIGSIKDLKGKTIALGGLVDITAIYWNAMAAANGLKPGDVDIVVIGATAGRFAALKSGSVDATMVLPPFSFVAEAGGFKNIGLVIDYVKDVPFTGLEVSKPWAKAHMAEAKRLLKALDDSAAWFYAPEHRQELIDIGVKDFHIDQKESALSLDFLRKIQYFAPTSKVPAKGINELIAVMRASHDVTGSVTAKKLAMPGLTELVE
ncbi:MAG TPA: ABC transporter substrate-binding protein [Stellaceae bacterium]|nr:ABC transporter substrate-binding protein [Stellaceae bacterium]